MRCRSRPLAGSRGRADAAKAFKLRSNPAAPKRGAITRPKAGSRNGRDDWIRTSDLLNPIKETFLGISLIRFGNV